MLPRLFEQQIEHMALSQFEQEFVLHMSLLEQASCHNPPVAAAHKKCP